MNLELADAVATATAVRQGNISAVEVVITALARIAARDRELNCFTTVTAEKALADAKQIDRAVAAGKDPGPLAGVPFAVKNLFDIAGLTPLPGQKLMPRSQHLPKMQQLLPP